jgi:hypothetical protein
VTAAAASLAGEARVERHRLGRQRSGSELRLRRRGARVWERSRRKPWFGGGGIVATAVGLGAWEHLGRRPAYWRRAAIGRGCGASEISVAGSKINGPDMSDSGGIIRNKRVKEKKKKRV